MRQAVAIRACPVCGEHDPTVPHCDMCGARPAECFVLLVRILSLLSAELAAVTPRGQS